MRRTRTGAPTTKTTTNATADTPVASAQLHRRALTQVPPPSVGPGETRATGSSLWARTPPHTCSPAARPALLPCQAPRYPPRDPPLPPSLPRPATSPSRGGERRMRDEARMTTTTTAATHATTPLVPRHRLTLPMQAPPAGCRPPRIVCLRLEHRLQPCVQPQWSHVTAPSHPSSPYSPWPCSSS